MRHSNFRDLSHILTAGGALQPTIIPYDTPPRPDPNRVKKLDGLIYLDPEEMSEEGACPGGRYYYITDVDKAVSVMKYWAENKCWAAIDLETGRALRRVENSDGELETKYIKLIDPFTCPIYLMSVSVEPGVAVVFDIRTLGKELQFVGSCQQMLMNCNLVAHNSFFESTFLRAQFGVLPNIAFDTLIASQLLNAGLNVENGLDKVMNRYLRLELKKEWQEFFTLIHPTSAIPNEAVSYSAGDVCQLLTVAQMLEKELDEKELSSIYWEIEHPLLPTMTEARHEGVCVDTPSLKKVQVELEQELEQMQDYAGLNLSSTHQLKRWYQEQGLVLSSVDEKSLTTLLDTAHLPKAVREMTTTVLRRRSITKTIGTYCAPLLDTHINPVTKRVHPTWKQCHARTGRMASAEPNVQNMPPNIRRTIVAKPGHTFVFADYEGFEVRVLAHCSQDPLLIEAFREGKDVHGQAAAALFGDDYTPEQRRIAKAFVFGSAYGAGPKTLAASTERPIEEIRVLYNKFFQRYRGLKRWIDITAKKTQTELVSITPAGRKRFYELPDRTDELYQWKMGKIGREGTNAQIQGYNADCLKYATIVFCDRMRALGWDAKPLLFIHDELVISSPKDLVEQVKSQLEECMISAACRWIQDVPFAVSIYISDRWEKG